MTVSIRADEWSFPSQGGAGIISRTMPPVQESPHVFSIAACAAQGRGDRFFEGPITEVHVMLQLVGFTAALEPHSTLEAVLVQPHRLDRWHVGDSRVYQVLDRQVVHRGRDDTYGEQLRREGRLNAEGRDAILRRGA